MLRLFQNISPLSFFFLLVYFAGLAVHAWLFPEAADLTNLTYVSDLILHHWTNIADMPQRAVTVTALICIFLQGLIICFLLPSFKLLNQFSLVPAAVYYLFCFLFSEFITFFILLPVNFLLIWFVFRLFTIYNKQKITTALFDLGILLSLAITLYFPAAFFLLFGLYTMLKLRSTSLRETAIFFTACIMVFFLILTAFYWFDVLSMIREQFPLPQKISDISSVFDPVIAVKVFLSGILLMVSLFFLNRKYSSMLIQIRKYFACLIAYGIIAVASGALAAPLSIRNIFPAVLPATVIVSYFLINIKNRDTAEILHISLLGIVLLFQYINFAG